MPVDVEDLSSFFIAIAVRSQRIPQKGSAVPHMNKLVRNPFRGVALVSYADAGAYVDLWSTRTSAGSASEDAGFTIIYMPTEQKNMSRFSTLTLLNSSDHDTLSRRQEPSLLICGVKGVSSVL
jgi:ABC-type Fe2+-enterobactin transport system substrate-binding protein